MSNRLVTQSMTSHDLVKRAPRRLYRKRDGIGQIPCSYERYLVLHNCVCDRRCLSYCLSNAIQCMGQNIKSLAACVCVSVCLCVCVCVCAHGNLGSNISKTLRDRASVSMDNQ